MTPISCGRLLVRQLEQVQRVQYAVLLHFGQLWRTGHSAVVFVLVVLTLLRHRRLAILQMLRVALRQRRRTLYEPIEQRVGDGAHFRQLIEQLGGRDIAGVGGGHFERLLAGICASGVGTSLLRLEFVKS